MIKFLSARRKVIAAFCCILFLTQLLHPAVSLALTSGPSQPEVHSFQPAGTTEMVDLFSGDFSYNIPLFELPGPNGGYPFNLSYQAGIGMDQEASWVGLGWSLTPGAVTRQMRGLPDEFKGDVVKTKLSVKPSVTVGLGAGAGLEIFGSDGISLNVGFSVSHNNYKGIGYSIDNTLGFGRSSSGGMAGGVGLDVSLDSNEGVNIQPSLSLSNKIGEIGLQASYNSKAGFSSISFYRSVNDKPTDNSTKKDGSRPKFSSTSTLSMAHPGYTPQITMPMRNLNLSAEFRPGGSFWGVFGNLYVRGFYNEQRLDKRNIDAQAYGYLNYQHAASSKALLDFNREKDGMVTKESPNLAIPSLTYDVYSVTGQGISAMYRPMRNDYGMIHDQSTSSVSNGGTVGVDVGPAASHIGVHLSVNHSESTTGAWTERNQMMEKVKFQTRSVNDPYEPWYFKVHGEPNIERVDATDKLGGEKAVRVRLDKGNSDNTGTHPILENKTWNSTFTGWEDRERKPRNQVIQPITNEELLNGSEELISQFKIQYQDAGGSTLPFGRSALPPHHVAGFTATTADGLRYVYGLPAYNKKQQEVTFSAQQSNSSQQISRVPVVHGGDGDPKYDYHGTDEFLKSLELPAYTHSHLLTSIIGPDYVDLTGDGVSSDDLGYWVKFTYKRVASNYKWRDPFSQAHYQQGWITDKKDDKGSFVYGEKEIWYMARAETKSHIADFDTEARYDGKGVAQKLQDSDNTGDAVHRLKEIKLYTRTAGPATPIKVVKFDHDFSLCQKLYNNTGAGKLTLKRVWFEYGGSTRGSLNPYTFEYGLNPDYDNLAYDRWGNYKPYPTGEYDHNRDFPYVSQDPAGKSGLDNLVSAWSLKAIVLPSGGKITVDYESDDYGYVQHKTAMQMTEIVNPENFNSTTFNLKDNLLKIRFKLEHPFSGSITDAAKHRGEVLKYLDTHRKQVYFKVKIELREPGDGFHEYISGYADINLNGGMGLEKDGTSGDYTHGYFHVASEKGNGKSFHPFSMRAWQHLRTNQPELAMDGGDLEPGGSDAAKIAQIKALASIGTHVRQMFRGFYKYCSDQDWGREIVVGKSWVRLNSPDKIKYGGGLRVRQITMRDQWAEDQEGIYGQVYEYTMTEDNATISSGVASYEPVVGGDENPLRYAKKYVQSVPLRADNNLFFEYPINESYYPGPQVGYRKVTVWSLASAYLAGKEVKNIALSPGRNLFPQGEGVSYGTTGKTEHEFYTAKDYPVIVDETDKDNARFKLAVPVPFLGSLAIGKLASSQGYSIVTNDMHGKPKKISNYRQDRNGVPEKEPISWVKYNYLSESKVYEQERVNVVANVLKDNGDKTLSVPGPNDGGAPKFTLGQETEMFTDMRQYQDKSWSGGARVNTDILYIPIAFVIVPIPVPTVWPSVGKSENQLRTAVTNKVVFKSGILVSTEAYDGGSTMITRNAKWDKLTGTPVLTVTNNNFDAPVFNYSILAHSQYAGMGAAYQNTGLTFTMSSVTKDTDREGYYDFYTTLPEGSLYPGDEIILYENSELKKALAKAIYMGKDEGDNIIYTPAQLQLKDYGCMIVRSGFRNQLSVSAGSITALQDPSVPGTPVTHSKTITIVK